MPATCGLEIIFICRRFIFVIIYNCFREISLYEKVRPHHPTHTRTTVTYSK